MKRLLTVAAVIMSMQVPNALAEDGVTDTEIRIGSSIALSGLMKSQGEDLKLGIETYLKSVNDAGGVNGRKVIFDVSDDGYDPARALANAKKVVEGPSEKRIFAWLSQFGTSGSLSVMPYMDAKQVPFLFPFSGALDLRGRGRYVFNFRAPIDAEIEQIVNYATNTGNQNIAVVFQDEPYGGGGVAYYDGRAFAKRKLRPTTTMTIDHDGGNAEEAARSVYASPAKAVAVLGSDTMASKFIKTFSDMDKDSAKRILGTSIMNANNLGTILGGKSYGIIQTQVVPHPKSESTQAAVEARKIFTKYKIPLSKLNYTVFEGMINAKIMVEGLKVAGKDLTRDKFLDALESFGTKDFDGIIYGFTPKNHDGVKFVDMTIIDKQGNPIE